MTSSVQVYPAPVLIGNAGAVGTPPLNQTFADQRYPLMSRQEGNNGNVWMYVYSTLSISQNQLVSIQNGKITITPKGPGGIVAPQGPGAIPLGVTDQAVFGATSYGWVTIAGLCYVKFMKGTHTKKPLFVALNGVGVVTSTVSALTSVRSVRASVAIVGMAFAQGLQAAYGTGTQGGATGIGVLGTASASGDVRPVMIAGGGAFADKAQVESSGTGA